MLKASKLWKIVTDKTAEQIRGGKSAGMVGKNVTQFQVNKVPPHNVIFD